MSKKVLVVDDAKSMRQMISMSLKSAGYLVSEAEDGVSGLAMVKSDHYDLILTDVNMPNMDGMQMAQAIKAIPSKSAIPILFLTTESADSMKEKGKSLGVTGWIVKPFNPEKLINACARILG